MNLSKLILLSKVYSLLTNLKLRQVPVTMKAGIGAACYYVLTDSVRVDPPGLCDTLAIIFCDICHLFAHAYQRKLMGVLKYLLLKTFNRKQLLALPLRIGLKACEWYLNRGNK